MKNEHIPVILLSKYLQINTKAKGEDSNGYSLMRLNAKLTQV